MYLKSIEVQGFKSFANKILFEFHNGITGIVGPNGSGKSNVADAVRWVLGEQRAKQLRGASMQDVIFAGTESRKPLSYASVSITLDNSDHSLAVEYTEVTVTRRVYRSGESEYMINGASCRLKDVHELFYDTGIGKEGYSIIGQGQIDQILSGKPEERRELFDEAAGIVKFKRRKVTAQKKLEDEKQNLIRVNDILAELEKQVGPLEKQSEAAKIYLKKKEELKTYDVNMFLLEMEEMNQQLQGVVRKQEITTKQYEETNKSYENIRREYAKMEQEMEQLEVSMNEKKERLSQSSVIREKLEGQINVLNEQIRSAKSSEEQFQERLKATNAKVAEYEAQEAAYLEEKRVIEEQLSKATEVSKATGETLRELERERIRLNQCIEQGKTSQLELMNQRAQAKAREQRFTTMTEQINIRKAKLNQRLLKRKSDEEQMQVQLKEFEEKFQEITTAIAASKEAIGKLEEKRKHFRFRTIEINKELEKENENYHKFSSQLESMRNIAERYDGYGKSTRKVMEQKEHHKGVLGVVADLLKVDRTYETAIETALGGNIQNIVTEDEQTAKAMVRYLKENRLGRATFLPLTSVGQKEHKKKEEALLEEGVIGMAHTLVKTEEKYAKVAEYLLGRVYVVDHIDHALRLAKKFHYSLHIVTVEGEYLSPGGSISGGAFKNNSNLLGRNREIEELEKKVAAIQEKRNSLEKQKEEVSTAAELLSDDIKEANEELQQLNLSQNTAKMNVSSARRQMEEFETVYGNLQTEKKEIEAQVEEIETGKVSIQEEMEAFAKAEAEVEAKGEAFKAQLEETERTFTLKQEEAAKVRLEEANIQQKAGFLQENLRRVQGEKNGALEEVRQLKASAGLSKEEMEKRQADIEAIKKTIEASVEEGKNLEETISTQVQKKEEMNASYKGFFDKREAMSQELANLDKENFRLKNQQEKLEEARQNHTDYMWNEYELTLRSAMELRKEEYTDLEALKKWIANLKDEIRQLGDVNVNAIEDYKNLFERFTFMTEQRDDLVEAEKNLLDIIQELDEGMRRQFQEKFGEIQKEFDKTFKELFGGGKGTLELVDGEDILECGITITAQPPGKKLQNMMQLSGGEKALTAISLLFAIQNLKPSPFCLLDEIEAALDDSNVTRYAKYLHKLTEHTQFIVITHRKGTMEAADRLYGITMQEKGISTLVSVNLIENDLEN